MGADLERRVREAGDTAALFNSRENLFEQEMTEYESLEASRRLFEPFNNLWKSASEWLNSQESWMKGPFSNIDAEECEQMVDNTYQTITKVGSDSKQSTREPPPPPPPRPLLDLLTSKTL